jgi:RND family efflux transporter MFP subunit
MELRQAEIQLKQEKEGADADEILAAQSSLESAIANYEDVLAGPSEEEIIVASRALKEAELDLQDAQYAYDKVAYLGDVGSRSESTELQAATIAYEVALAEYEQAVEGPTEAEIKSAEASVVQAEQTLNDLLEGPNEDDIELAQISVELAQMEVEDAELDIEQSELYSPIDGIVVSVDTNEGELASDNSAAMTLADISKLHVEAGVDELDISSVEVEQPVEITLDAMEDEVLEGHVEEIITLPSEESSGIVEYTVRIAIDTSTDKLRPGMSAEATIEVERVEDVLVIPNYYLKVNMTTGDTYVQVLGTGNSISNVTVEIGKSDGTVTEITSGLEEGDVVVLQSDGDYGEVVVTETDEEEVNPGQMRQIMDGGGGPPGGGRP